MYSQKELNLHLRFRKSISYPLDDESKCNGQTTPDSLIQIHLATGRSYPLTFVLIVPTVRLELTLYGFSNRSLYQLGYEGGTSDFNEDE